jgi:hypothetical protein
MTLPAATPVTAPEVAFTVAVVGVALLHVPPAVALDNVDVAVTQAFVVPVILATVGTSIIEIAYGMQLMYLRMLIGLLLLITYLKKQII